MADINDAKEAILDLLVEISKTQPSSGTANDRNDTHKVQAEAIMKLAEAHAWLLSPAHARG